MKELRSALALFRSWQEVQEARLPDKWLLAALRCQTIQPQQIAPTDDLGCKGDGGEEAIDDPMGTCPGHWAVTPSIAAAYDISLDGLPASNTAGVGLAGVVLGNTAVPAGGLAGGGACKAGLGGTDVGESPGASDAPIASATGEANGAAPWSHGEGGHPLPTCLQILALSVLREAADRLTGNGERSFDRLLRTTDSHDATTLHR